MIGVTIMVITPLKPKELALRRAASVKVGNYLEFYSLMIQVYLIHDNVLCIRYILIIISATASTTTATSTPTTTTISTTTTTPTTSTTGKTIFLILVVS